MHIYKHQGKGFYVGSCVVVYAFNRKQAEEMIRKELDKNGLKKEKVNITEIHSLGNATVIHTDNGDY